MRIFISKPISELPLLKAACERNKIELVAESLIDFEMLPAQIPDISEIVFFTSPRSVIFFFKQAHSEYLHVSFACMGKGTEKSLNQFGHKAEFVGLNSSDPEKTFKEFSDWAGKRTITVPHAKDSLFTILKFVDPSLINFIPVYQTKCVLKDIISSDVYIFTSPSNVNSFFKTNKLHPSSKIIAWGTSTQSQLHTMGIQVNFTLEYGNESEIIRFLNLI